MKIKLQSLSGFHAFESAARHLSFTKAGEELHVTQAAVSQQIKQLENQLGFKLFKRMTRKIVLTTEGKRLAETVRQSLTNIADTIEDILEEEKGGTVTISTITSFAMKWLIPRMGRFREKHPDVQLNIHTDDKIVDLNEYNVDLAIRNGIGIYPNLDVTLMMREEVFPVCSPDLIKGKKKLEIKDIYEYELLEDEVQWEIGVEFSDWNIWLNAVGIDDIDTHGGTSFSNSVMALQAAVDGHGIAMCRTSLAADDLTTGRLVKPFDVSVETPNAYYIVCLKEKAGKTRIKKVKQWLLEEVLLSSSTP